jgi:molybdate transport system substrate-binding protein
MSTFIQAGSRQARKGTTAILGLAALLMLACSKSPEGAAPAAGTGLKIAAAADLTNAFEDIGREYERVHQGKVTFVFGSSGLLAKQISQGAPYDAFYSANAAFADEAIASGNCDGSTKARYAKSQIVIWTRDGLEGAAPTGLADLEDPRFKRIAIANPDHAPYGRAAKEALEKAGLWEKVQSRVVMGDNVKHTLQYAETGNADAAIIPLPLALRAKGGRYVDVDKDRWVEQTKVLCLRGPDAAGARKFDAFLKSEQGRVIMQQHGFTLVDS